MKIAAYFQVNGIKVAEPKTNNHGLVPGLHIVPIEDAPELIELLKQYFAPTGFTILPNPCKQQKSS